VVVLGTEGNVKWIYQGHPQINTEYKLELSQIERRMSLRFVKAMSKISTGISLMVMI
jgi:hypothetical protein